MSRDLLGLVWMGVVLALYGVGLSLTTPAAEAGTLALGPDPGLGVLVSLVIALFAGLGGWLWLDEPAWVGATKLGQRFGASAGRRERRRALLLHVGGFALALLIWWVVGPSRAFDVQHLGFDGSMTCTTTVDASLLSLCRWDATRWAPLLGAALTLLLVMTGAFWSRSVREDLLALRVDGVGLVFEGESRSERLAWSEVLGAELTRTGILVTCRNGGRHEVPLQGLPEFERGNLVFRINGHAELHRPEPRVDLQHEPRLQRMLRSRE